MKQNTLALLCALAFIATACFSLLGCGGCAGGKPGTGQEAENSGPPREAAAPKNPQFFSLQDVAVRPTESELSPEAQCTYAYLLYVQALTDEDEDALLLAATQLKEARVPTRIWLEGGVWLMSRKSPKVLDLLEQADGLAPGSSLNLLHAEALMEHGMPEKGVGADAGVS